MRVDDDRTNWVCRRFGAAVVLAFMAMLPAACGEEPQTVKKEIVRPAKILTVSRTVRKLVRVYPGRVEAPEWADLAFEVTGRMIKLNATEGEKVKKGSMIAQLDPEDFRLEVAQIQAKVNQSKTELGRLKKLVKQGHISRSRYDKGLRKFQVEEAALAQVKRNLGYTTIKAPYDAVIAKRYLKNFQIVQRGQKIVRIQDLSSIDISIQVPEDIAAAFRATIILESAVATFEAAPGRKFPVKYKEASTQAERRTQSFKAVVTMKPPEGLTIRPGMTASVRLVFVPKGKTQSNAIVVPASAVASDPAGGFYVWVVKPKTAKVSKRKVKVGKLGKTTIEVLDGLKDGERIVAAGVSFLREGDKVRPMVTPNKAK